MIFQVPSNPNHSTILSLVVGTEQSHGGSDRGQKHFCVLLEEKTPFSHVRFKPGTFWMQQKALSEEANICLCLPSREYIHICKTTEAEAVLKL